MIDSPGLSRVRGVPNFDTNGARAAGNQIKIDEAAKTGIRWRHSGKSLADIRPVRAARNFLSNRERCITVYPQRNTIDLGVGVSGKRPTGHHPDPPSRNLGHSRCFQ